MVPNGLTQTTQLEDPRTTSSFLLADLHPSDRNPDEETIASSLRQRLRWLQRQRGQEAETGLLQADLL